MTFSVLGIDTQTHERVELPKASRPQGLYIIGIQGTGKSGLIENLIMQDIKQQIGVCVLDPHGELIDHVIARLPGKAEEDKVILLDLANSSYPFGLNLFACPDPTDDGEIVQTLYQVLHVFEKAYGIVPTTPLMYDLLYNTAYALIANPGYSMIDIRLLLTNEACRKKLLANVTNPDVSDFWRIWDDPKQTTLSEQEQKRGTILNKMNDFSHVPLRNIVGQSSTTFDLANIMDAGKILLVKLSRRLEQPSNLIGSIIIAQLLNAAYARPTNKRKQFHLYADEFQNFATEDFATLLEEARKFGIATTIAHQNRGQLNSANSKLETDLKDRSRSVGNMVVFKINSKDADDLAGEFNVMSPTPGPMFEHVMEPVYRYWEEAVWDSTEIQQEYRTLTEDYARLFIQLEALGKFALTERNKYGTPPLYEPVGHKHRLNWDSISPEGWHYAYHVLMNMTPASSQWQEVVKEYAEQLQPDFMHSDEVGTYLLQTFYEPRILRREYHEDKVLVIRSSIREGMAYYLPPELPTYFEQHIKSAGIGGALNGLQPQLFPLFQPNHTVDNSVSNYWEAREDDVVAGEIMQATRDAFLNEVQAVFWPMKAQAPYYFDAKGYWEHCEFFGDGLVDTDGNRYTYEAWRHYMSIFGINWHWKWPLFPDMAWWIRNKILQLVQHQEEVEKKRTTLWNEHHRVVKRKQFLYYRPKTAMQLHRSWLHPDDYVDAPIYRMKEGASRPIADVRNEMASRLVNLPNFTARVKIATTNGTIEHGITTLEPEKGLYGKPLEERITRIRANNIRDKYLRERKDIEAEIIQRQQRCSGSAPAQPQIPQQQTSHARQVPVQGNCPNCNATNPRGARFCNHCGTKLT